MTACWSKGRNKLYPYYLCDTRACDSNRKSVPRARVEDGFAEILRTLQPTGQMLKIAKAMFRDAWRMRLSEARNEKESLTARVTETEKQIEALLDRIVEASSPSVIAAYEKRIAKLEREKLLLEEKADKIVPPKGRLEEFIEPALEFLSNPWNLYQKGSLTLKRTVLRLAFEEPLRYSRENGYRTAKTTFPFKVLADFYNQKSEMVGPEGRAA